MASTMRMLRAPNCANTPFIIIQGSRSFGFPHGNNGARTHDLPLVRRALSQLSYVSIFVKSIAASVFRLRNREWSWRESNPRPKTHPMYFYYHSPFFFIPSAVRSFPLLYGNEHPYRFSSFILRLTAQSFAGIVSHMFDTGFPTCECIRSGMQHLGCS